jgi:hypothetical protein
MTEDAKKRLEAIESLEDLGAGFTPATHDLEIRGVGELLGDEQSGQIHEIGFALYMDPLERAVQALKAGKTPELDRGVNFCTKTNGMRCFICATQASRSASARSSTCPTSTPGWSPTSTPPAPQTKPRA